MLPLGPLGALVEDVRRIAVLRANGIGDLVVTLPALEAVREAYPASEVTLLGRRHHADLLLGRPSPVDRVEVVPPYRGVVDAPEVAPGGPSSTPETEAFLEGQRLRRYDLALQLHGGGAHSTPFLRRLQPRLLSGSRADGAPPADRDVTYAAHQHEVVRFLEVVGLVGAAPVTLQPRLAVVPEDLRAAATVLPDPARRRPLVVVHAGATDVRRRWPPQRFAAVADALTADGATVVLVGTPEEARATSAVASAARARLLDLTGRLGLRALVGVLASADLVVANDSGPRHVAEAVGTRTASVYWCGNLPHAALTRARHRVAVSWRQHCPACGGDGRGRRCPHDDSWVADVEVEEVLGDARALLAEASGEVDEVA